VEKLFPNCVLNKLPEDSEAWIIEGMFMLGTVPISECTNLRNYVSLLVRRWILPKLNGKCQDIAFRSSNARVYDELQRKKINDPSSVI
jgi:hypothetical protein